jgi:hypothetical protein
VEATHGVGLVRARRRVGIRAEVDVESDAGGVGQVGGLEIGEQDDAAGRQLRVHLGSDVDVRRQGAEQSAELVVRLAVAVEIEADGVCLRRRAGYRQAVDHERMILSVGIDGLAVVAAVVFTAVVGRAVVGGVVVVASAARGEGKRAAHQKEPNWALD